MAKNETFSKWIPKHPKTNAWISTSQIAQEGDKVLLKSSQGEIFEVEPEVLKPNHCDVHILIRRVGENKILEMENVGVEMCWRFSCLYDYMDYIWIYYTVYMYVQYTYLPWLAEVFSWTKSKDKWDLVSMVRIRFATCCARWPACPRWWGTWWMTVELMKRSLCQTPAPQLLETKNALGLWW